MSDVRGNDAMLVATELVKVYGEANSVGVPVPVLNGASLTIAKGERVAIVGRSGSGKSTLLHLLAGLDEPGSGTITVAGHRMSGVALSRRAELRNRYLGFVYQFHHLLPEFDARENVAMPLLLGARPRAEAFARAEALLGRVGLGHRLTHRPHELSGGERQRVAVARALAPAPAVVLADEPTGSLDRFNGAQIIALMDELSRESSTAFVLVTHDENLFGWTDRVLTLEDGRLHPGV